MVRKDKHWNCMEFFLYGDNRGFCLIFSMKKTLCKSSVKNSNASVVNTHRRILVFLKKITEHLLHAHI